MPAESEHGVERARDVDGRLALGRARQRGEELGPQVFHALPVVCSLQKSSPPILNLALKLLL
eukprot:8363123-Pyramimonas_sp.AAC.1